MGRFGILTAGGDCPGSNAAIRGFVRTLRRRKHDVIGIQRGYEGLLEPVSFINLTPEKIRGIIHQGGTLLGSTNKGRFVARKGAQERVEIDPIVLRQAKEAIEMLSLDGLACIGGDGSLSIALQFHEAGVPVVAIPKTIDNDLAATVRTFGFDTAVSCAVDAIDRLHTTAVSHERIMILEVMGRHAGWIALHAGIAGGADVILLPEIPWTIDGLVQQIGERSRGGAEFTIIVIAEGAELPEHGISVKDKRELGQVRLGGVGEQLAILIESHTGREARCVALGHLQRGGTPTANDRLLATRFGVHAAELVEEGRFGQMVSYQPPEIGAVPIADAVSKLSTVNPDCSLIEAARRLGIGFGDPTASHSRPLNLFSESGSVTDTVLMRG